MHLGCVAGNARRETVSEELEPDGIRDGVDFDVQLADGLRRIHDRMGATLPREGGNVGNRDHQTGLLLTYGEQHEAYVRIVGECGRCP